nr:DUF2071 domain-containing protein [Candidatus Palauibacterales bacterium]
MRVSSSAPRRPFLTARWESLVLVSWACPAAILEPLVPRGTELDEWQGEHLVSLVGFLFRDTRVLGVPVPRHRTFEEVNLRFYVRRTADGETRRAVVFIRELVPRRAIAAVARRVYDEPYLAVPMDHSIALDARSGGQAVYGWRFEGAPFGLGAEVEGAARPLEPGSEAEFITEHYWGYTRRRDGRTLEYRVDHPRWRVWEADRALFGGPAPALYGPGLGQVLSGRPRSAFVAVGSEVTVYRGRALAGSRRRAGRPAARGLRGEPRGVRLPHDSGRPPRRGPADHGLVRRLHGPGGPGAPAPVP